jgi:hypothetical protein
MNFTNAEKLAEIEREIKQRHRVYAHLIRTGKLRPSTAERQMLIMSAIRDDYAAKVAEGPLFERLDQ